jgi:transcriptional regulator with XRE-family HTH domain
MGMIELGARLRQLRLARELKQVDIAPSVHLSREMVSNYERGNVQGIGTQLIHDWARVLDADEEELRGLAGAHLTLTETYDRDAPDPIKAALRKRLGDDPDGDLQFSLLVRIADTVREWFREMDAPQSAPDAQDRDRGAA